MSKDRLDLSDLPCDDLDDFDDDDGDDARGSVNGQGEINEEPNFFKRLVVEKVNPNDLPAHKVSNKLIARRTIARQTINRQKKNALFDKVKTMESLPATENNLLALPPPMSNNAAATHHVDSSSAEEEEEKKKTLMMPDAQHPHQY